MMMHENCLMYREARVMDQTNENLKAIRSRVVVPHSIPGLVTERVLVMTYLDGVPLTQLEKHVQNISPAKKKAAFKRVRCLPEKVVERSRAGRQKLVSTYHVRD
jgi:predicted unusual protein kinase regulating ubiquinone biosynthesis (AarF/ABC1/UbiB family)